MKEIYWSQFADSFEEKNKYVVGLESMQIVLNEVAKQKKLGKTLELGCGNGTYSRVLYKNTQQLTCTDFSDEMLAVSKERLKDLKHIKIKKANCFHLPFEAETFDTVFMANLLHIIPTPEKAIKEAQRVLKQSGNIIILDFTTKGMGLYAKIKMTYRYFKAYGKRSKTGQVLGLKEMKTLLNNCGLSLKENRLIGKDSKAVFAIATK